VEGDGTGPSETGLLAAGPQTPPPAYYQRKYQFRTPLFCPSFVRFFLYENLYIKRMSNMRPYFQPNGYYHIYNRGFGKKTIFHSDRDFRKFIFYVEETLAIYSMLTPVIYCILPNHFHLLIHNTTQYPDHTISRCMQRIQSSYVNYYQTKYKNTKREKKKGLPLFE
jgi:REP element-mobilizing transposase RayT